MKGHQVYNDVLMYLLTTIAFVIPFAHLPIKDVLESGKPRN